MSPDRSPAIDRRSLFKAALVVPAGVLVGYYINQSLVSTPRPIWEYDSYPPHLLHWDVAFRTATDPLMTVLADGIIAHFFDWQNIKVADKRNEIQLPGDPRAIPRRNFLQSVEADSRWGWQQVMLLGVDRSHKDIDDKFWQVGFRLDSQTIRKCRIKIPITERIAVLTGQELSSFYALSLSNQALPATVVGPYNRHQVSSLQARLI